MGKGKRSIKGIVSKAPEHSQTVMTLSLEYSHTWGHKEKADEFRSLYKCFFAFLMFWKYI